MSRRSRGQALHAKLQEWGIYDKGQHNNTRYEDIYYWPFDEIGTKFVRMYGAATNVFDAAIGDYGVDYTLDDAIGAGHPRSVELNGLLTVGLHGITNTKSWAMFFVSKPSAIISTVEMKLGVATASKSSVLLSNDGTTTTGEVEYITGVKDVASGAEQLTVGQAGAKLLICDRQAGTLKLYGADRPSNPFVLAGTLDSALQSNTINFPNPTEVKFSNTIPGSCYGALFITTDAGIAWPDDILDIFKQLHVNWVDGELGLAPFAMS